MAVDVYGVPTEHIEELWPVLHPYVASAILKGSPVPTTTPEQVKSKLLAQQSQGWVAVRDEEEILAFMTTYISIGDIFNSLVIENCAGVEADTWIPLYDEVEGFAKEKGLEQVIIRGRPGWAKKLKNLGFQQQFVTLSKPI